MLQTITYKRPWTVMEQTEKTAESDAVQKKLKDKRIKETGRAGVALHRPLPPGSFEVDATHPAAQPPLAIPPSAMLTPSERDGRNTSD